MAGYTLYTGGPYKQRNGSAITASSTDVDGGAAKNVPDGENLVRSNFRTGSQEIPAQVGGVNAIGAAQWTLVDAYSISDIQASVAATHGYAGLALIDVGGGSHAVAAGDLLLFLSDLDAVMSEFPQMIYRVVKVYDADEFIINTPYTAAMGSVTDINIYRNVGNFNSQAIDNFIMKKNDGTVHGQAESKLSSGAADYGRLKVAKFDETFKTRQVKTAIRGGYYNITTGEFSTAPTVADDSFNTDDEVVDSTTKYGLKSENTVREGGARPASRDYEAKTG